MFTEAEMRWHQLRRFHKDVLAESTFTADRLQHPHAKRHLKEGFNRRLLMMEVSAREIQRTSKDSSRPLPPYRTAQLTLYLNAFYLNLRGALDNLAWALAYELDMRPDLSEESRKCQVFCNLFRKDFQDELEAQFPSLIKMLKELDDWFSELRTLRDPAAHRIPLCFPSSVMSKDEGVQWEALQEEAVTVAGRASEALDDGDLEAAERLIHESFDFQDQASGLGRFVPVIITSEASGHENRSAPYQLEQDEANFLKIARTVISQCLKSAA